MLRGLYGSAAGMIAQQQRQEMLTNNLANANTPGFKADQAAFRSFPNMLIKAMNTNTIASGRSPIVGELSTGVYMQERMPNFLQGDITQTGNTTDIALLQGVIPRDTETGRPGALFFPVQNEAGDVRYSRNGNFAVDGQGFLTSGEGFYLLDTNGARIQVGNENFRVDRDGSIFLETGEFLTQINVAFAQNPMNLVKEGNGLYRFEGEEALLPTAIGNPNVGYQLVQGSIERSNVDPTQTMTEMMNAFRIFEANQKVLQAYDRSLEKAVNEIGRIG